MQVQWSSRARRDLRDIYEYLADRNAPAANRIRSAIWDQAQLLADYPSLGRVRRSPEARELAIARTPYIVLYAVDRSSDTVHVLRVLHGARPWPEDL